MQNVAISSGQNSIADSEKNARGGPALTTFFYDEGKEDPNSTNAGHLRPASEH